MATTNDFWLQLHRLAGCLEDEGKSPCDRQAKIIAAWEVMPRAAREEVARDLATLLRELPEISETLDTRLQRQAGAVHAGGGRAQSAR